MGELAVEVSGSTGGPGTSIAPLGCDAGCAEGSKLGCGGGATVGGDLGSEQFVKENTPSRKHAI